MAFLPVECAPTVFRLVHLLDFAGRAGRRRCGRGGTASTYLPAGAPAPAAAPTGRPARTGPPLAARLHGSFECLHELRGRYFIGLEFAAFGCRFWIIKNINDDEEHGFVVVLDERNSALLVLRGNGQVLFASFENHQIAKGLVK